MNINDNEQSAKSQNAMIASWLNEGNAITQMQALNLFGCFRLASRIHDLRDKGMMIISEKIITPTGKRVCRYRLKTNED